MEARSPNSSGWSTASQAESAFRIGPDHYITLSFDLPHQYATAGKDGQRRDHACTKLHAANTIFSVAGMRVISQLI